MRWHGRVGCRDRLPRLGARRPGAPQAAGRVVDLDARRRRLVAGPRRTPHPAPTTRSCSTTPTSRSRTRRRAGNRTACTAPAGSTTTRRSPGTTRWPGRAFPARSSTSCTSARSPRAPLSTRDRAARPPRRPGRHARRAAAGQRLQRRLELGLRRRRLVRRARALRRPGRAQAVRRRRARPGLAVVLDVVYNHLGPSGNYLPRFGPYLKSGRNTWGDLVNLESPEVRAFIIDNALMWLRDYHVDALRLDAVHALRRFLDAAHPGRAVRRGRRAGERLGRPLTLIAESDLNDPVMITPRPSAGTAWPRSGTTTCTTRCTRCSPASARATTATSARWPCWPRCSRRRSCTTAPTRRSAAGCTAAPSTGAIAGVAVRRLPAEPRPGRQPRGRRPAARAHLARPAARRRGAAADLAVHPDALDG